MPVSPSVVRIKQTLIDLCKVIPLESISVNLLLEKSKVSKTTFYKHFKDMDFLWHTISHDFIYSMGHLHKSIQLTPSSLPINNSQKDIQKMSALPTIEYCKYNADFIYANRKVFAILLEEHHDRWFLSQWSQMIKTFLSAQLLMKGIDSTRANKVANALSYSYISGCLNGIKHDGKEEIYDSIYTVIDNIFHYQNFHDPNK